jgi:hypothetical protein
LVLTYSKARPLWRTAQAMRVSGDRFRLIEATICYAT